MTKHVEKKITNKEGKVFTVLISKEDEKTYNKYNWYTVKGCSTYYVQTSKVINGKEKKIPLHRLLLNPKPDQEIDHQNRNGLDNRRSNIRIATRSQNMHNRIKKKNSCSSKYKGVSYRKDNGLWAAYYSINNTRYHLGFYSSEEEAASAYNYTAEKLDKKFALINNIQEKDNTFLCEKINKLLTEEKKEPSSQFKGVSHIKNRGWEAYITKNQKRKYLGIYSTEIEAYKIRKTAEKILKKENISQIPENLYKKVKEILERKPPQQTSNYLNVYWSNTHKSWRSVTYINKKRTSLGYYKTETEAAQAYNTAIEFFKLDRPFNIISKPSKKLENEILRKIKGIYAWGKSKYRGVCWKDENHKWQAYITINKKRKYLGYHTKEVDAAKAYNNYIITHNLNRSLNKIEGEKHEKTIFNSNSIT